MEFTGFLPGDFGQYVAEKQSSNSWNRHRLEVKQRAMALGAAIQERLAGQGLSLSLEASDPNPSVWNKRRVDAQWVFLWRGPEERAALQAVVDRERKLADSILDPTPFHKHVFLCCRIHDGGIEVGMRLHRDAWVDRKNLLSRCATDEGVAATVEVLRALPDRFIVSAPGAVEVGAHDVDAAAIDAILGAFGETSEWVAVAEEVGVPEAVDLAGALVDRAADSLAALVPVYRHVAWSRDNDFTRLDEALERQAASREEARRALEAERTTRQDDRAVAAREAAQRAKEKQRDVALAHAHALFGPERRKEPARPAAQPRPAKASEPARKPQPDRKPAQRSAPASPKPAAARPAREAPAPAALRPPGPIARGSRVRIEGGPFSGKVGTVAEVDSKGQAKVLLGLLVARVEISQLSPVAAGRG